ncbi:hypothetical protein BT93_D1379 [Corymbia citriodora subsp. variegata]|nr:hypothetical protein BT93_D1379 [Corymbia citriodora subsp. variegata]
MSAGVAVSLIRHDFFVFPNLFDPQSSAPIEEPILVYVAVAGSKIPMRVLETDSIESVKLQIQNFKGFFVRNQKLVCRGRELSRNNSLVRDYGVENGNELHLVLRLSDLQVIRVRTTCGKEFTFHVERSKDVGYIKQQIAKKARAFIDSEEQEVVCNGERIEDQRLIEDISQQNGAEIHLLVRKSRPVEKNFELSIVATELNGRRKYDAGKENEQRQGGVREECRGKEGEFDGDLVKGKPLEKKICLEPILVNPKIELSSLIRDMINSSFEGLVCGYQPVRSMEGTGGAYFMRDSFGQKYISVFKPIDEEPMAVNNPNGLPLSENGEGLKKGTKVGGGAFREVAAYLLDHPKTGRRTLYGDAEGFAGVPPTAMVKCLNTGFNHPNNVSLKIGSLQMFMENEGSCEDMGPGSFPVNEVHKISVLDIRLANADRHAGNILLSREGVSGQPVLIPIDHGYCLPESFEDCTFDWLYWPQARQPYSPETIDYIRSLDAEEDIALLKFHGWDLPLRCARVLRISTMLLKKGVERGLTPFAIGSIMCRETLHKCSIIEEIVQKAEESLLPDSSESAFLDEVSQKMDSYLDEIEESLLPDSSESAFLDEVSQKMDSYPDEIEESYEIEESLLPDSSKSAFLDEVFQKMDKKMDSYLNEIAGHHPGDCQSPSLRLPVTILDTQVVVDTYLTYCVVHMYMYMKTRGSFHCFLVTVCVTVLSYFFISLQVHMVRVLELLWVRC